MQPVPNQIDQPGLAASLPVLPPPLRGGNEVTCPDAPPGSPRACLLAEIAALGNSQALSYDSLCDIGARDPAMGEQATIAITTLRCAGDVSTGDQRLQCRTRRTATTPVRALDVLTSLVQFWGIDVEEPHAFAVKTECIAVNHSRYTRYRGRRRFRNQRANCGQQADQSHSQPAAACPRKPVHLHGFAMGQFTPP